MSTHELKPGDRVRLTAKCRMHGYQKPRLATARSGA
jgi:hypothetical protein